LKNSRAFKLLYKSLILQKNDPHLFFSFDIKLLKLRT